MSKTVLKYYIRPKNNVLEIHNIGHYESAKRGCRSTQHDNSPENIIAEAAPMTPKNGP